MDIINLERDDIKAELTKLSVEFDNRAGTEVLRKKLADTLGVPLEPVSISSGNDSEKPRGKTVVINIPSTETDRHPVKVGINGKMNYIERDKDVEIPSSWLEILNNAVETRIRDEGTAEKPKLVPYDVPRFTFSVKG